ncbi:MAG: RIO1 family regulatory kinase/ATPase [Candidatus Nitrosocaldus sp.]
MVPIEYLLREPFIHIIKYPYNSNNSALEDARARIKEMEALGVKGILLGGKSVIHGLNVLGKGCTSIVVKALLDVHSSGACRNSSSSRCNDSNVEDYHAVNYDDNDDAIIVALKMMRSDSGRVSMEREANMLAMANNVGIGPNLISYSSNLLAMELIDGMHMVELIRELESRNNNYHPIRIRSILNDILEQCFILDSIGLDHGELGNMNRHVMISDRTYIIDFESSSTTRRVANVTSAVNYILFGIGSRVLAGMLNLYTRRDEVISALSRYRLDMNRERFNELLTLLDLKFYKESSK